MNLLIDLIYGVNKVRKNFLEKNPGEQIITINVAKGKIVSGKNQTVQSQYWKGTKKDVIILSPLNIQFGKFAIPLITINEAQLEITTTIFGRSQILKIRTLENVNFQFEMDYYPDWEKQKVLPLLIKTAQNETSVVGIIIRIAAAGLLTYIMIKSWGK